MPSIPLTNLLERAVLGGYAVGYFESWDLDSLEAVLAAAEEERSPVVAGFGGMMVDGAWLERGGIAMLGAAARSAVDRATVPVSLMFNEAQTEDQVAAALLAGFGSVLLSTDALPPAQALDVTASLVRRAHACGVAVEAELGHLPDASAGAEAGGEMTDPAQAAEFVRATGIDCLAVSVGNVHVKTDGWARLDRARIEALRTAVDVPFALHGGTSLAPDDLPHAISHGVAKINVGTVLKHTYLDALRGTLDALPAGADVHAALGSHRAGDITAGARAALTAKVRELIRLYGSSGRAAR